MIRLLTLLYYVVQLVYLVYYCNTTALVGVLTWLDDPYVPHLATALHLLLLLPLHLPLTTLVVLHEPLVLWIFDSLFDVKGQRHILEHISS